MRTPRTDRARRRPFASLAVVLLLLLLPSCEVHTHRVGGGSTGIGEESARQWYVFWGLFQLNEANEQRLIDNLTSYDIRTAREPVDWLLSILFLPVTVTTRTVTVSK